MLFDTEVTITELWNRILICTQRIIVEHVDTCIYDEDIWKRNLEITDNREKNIIYLTHFHLKFKHDVFFIQIEYFRNLNILDTSNKLF